MSARGALCSTAAGMRICLTHPPQTPWPCLRAFTSSVPTSRSFHNLHERRATPIAHPAVTGPPPEPPQGGGDQSDAIAARKRRNAALLQRGQDIKAAGAGGGSNSSSSSSSSSAQTPSSTSATSPPQSPLQKRFWKNVSVQVAKDGSSHNIYLDKRPVRTPSKEVLTLPASKRALATAIALEWDTLVSAQQALRSHHIPLTSAASRALDIVAADAAGNPRPRNDVVRMLMRYFGTDTLLCWAPAPSAEETMAERSGDGSNSSCGSSSSHAAVTDQTVNDGTSGGAGRRQSLRAQQIAAAEPIVAFLTQHVFPGASFRPALEDGGIMTVEQDEGTKRIVEAWLRTLPAWELAALERGTLATKSLLVAARLVVEWSSWLGIAGGEHDGDDRGGSVGYGDGDGEGKGRRRWFGIVEAGEAATVEVRWQTGLWGEIEETHHVEREDLARQLGTVVLLVTQ